MIFDLRLGDCLDPVTGLASLPDKSVDLSACVPWNGNRNQKGYGIAGRRGLAHRVAWVDANGAIPRGLCVLHRCDNPPCVNVAHLFLGTHADNMRDMIAKGRDRKARGADHPRRKHPERWPSGDQHWSRQRPGSLAGENNGRARLTREDVEMARIAHADGQTFRSLARRFGVDRRTITQAIKGETWI